MTDIHRVRTPEEKRRLQLARRRYAKRFRRIEQTRRKGPQFLMVLLCLLVISLILYKMFGPELLQEGTAEVSDTFSGDEAIDPSVVRADPESLRPEIEAFETALFGGLDARDLTELASSISLEGVALAERLGREELPRLQQLGTRVESIIDRIQGSSLDMERLEDVRQRWIDARDESLRRAPWFQAPSVTASQDAALHTVYRDAAMALLELNEGARSEAELFADMVNDGESIGSAWRDFEDGFSDQLRDIERSLPAERPGAKASPRLLAAIQQLEKAIDYTRERVAIEVPTYPLRSRPYDEAVEAAQGAVDAFDRVGG